MKKKIIALILCAAALLTLAACGSPAGTYKIKSCTLLGAEVDADKDTNYITLNKDGSFTMVSDVSGSVRTSEGGYTIDGEAFYMDGEKVGTLKGSVLTIEEPSVALEMVFKK